MSALIVSDDGKMKMKQGPDQFCVFQSVLSKAVNDDYGPGGLIRVICHAVQGPAFISGDRDLPFLLLQAGQYGTVHDFTVTGGTDQIIFIKHHAHEISSGLCRVFSTTWS